MRKLFSGGMVTLAVGVVAFAGVADHVRCCPDTWLSRRFLPAIESPRGSLIGVVSGTIAYARANAPAPEPAGKLMAVPMTEECADEPLGPQVVEASEPIQVGTPALVANGEAPGPECGLAATGSLEACGLAAAVPPDPTLVPVPTLVPEETMTMPTCPDEDDSQKLCMPYAEEHGNPTDARSFFDAWFHWLKKDVGKEGDGDDPVEKLVPYDPTVAPEFPAEKESAAPMNPPKCEEDPNYHHQYPGCPYTGGCPYGEGRCPPEMKPEAAPVPKPKNKMKVQASPMSRTRKLRTLLDGGLDLKECHTDEIKLDTMECRPSDMRGVGFDPKAPF
jgi:hypothetical protein